MARCLETSVKEPGYLNARRATTAGWTFQARRLAVFVACLLLLAPSGGVAQSRPSELSVGGAGSMIRSATRFSEVFEKTHPGLEIRIEPGSSRSALQAVMAGTLDIGLVGFTIAAAERAGLHVVPVSKQPILLITNATNPVENLTLAQLRGIYQGTVTNWKQVGGEHQAIVPFTRRKNSVVRQVFMRTVFGNPVAPPDKEKAFRIAKDKVLKTIRKIQGSLGFASTSPATARTSGVKVLAVDGNLPTHPNVADGRYPLTRTLFVISADHPGGVILEWIQGFVEFVRNESGTPSP